MNKPVEMDDNVNERSFVFLERKYDANNFFVNAGTCPKIPVKLSEISQDETLTELINLDKQLIDDSVPTLFKYGGKLLIVMGRNKIQQSISEGKADIVARLISKHILKKCVFDDNPEETKQLLEEQINTSLRPKFNRNNDRDDRGNNRRSREEYSDFARSDKPRSGRHEQQKRGRNNFDY